LQNKTGITLLIPLADGVMLLDAAADNPVFSVSAALLRNYGPLLKQTLYHIASIRQVTRCFNENQRA
jgi:hypothetical protein